MGNDRLAVLVDAENVDPALYPELCRKVGKLDRYATFKLFGDFSGSLLSPWLEIAKADGLAIEMQISGGKGKNSADIALSIHAMDMLHSGHVDGICIVSSDRDFAPLVARLRNSHLKVFGFGAVKSAKQLRIAYEEFHVLERPDTKVKKAKKPPLTSPNALVKAMTRIIDDDGNEGWIALSRASKAMIDHYPDIAKDACRKNKFLKTIRSTERFAERGQGSALEVRLSLPN